MTWSFYAGALDPNIRTKDNLCFLLAMDPRKVRPMIDGLGKVDFKLAKKLERNTAAVLLGRAKLAAINKRVGDRFKLSGISPQGIDLDLKVVGKLPPGKFDHTGIMNVRYLHEALDQYRHKIGKPHPLADKSLNMIWLRVRDKAAFARVSNLLKKSPRFVAVPIKCEVFDKIEPRNSSPGVLHPPKQAER